MDDVASPTALKLSLMRALWGAVHPQLRAASIEADIEVSLLRVRFEYDGPASPEVLESCQIAGTECIADLPGGWSIDEQHISRPFPAKCEHLQHLVYARYEAG